MACGGFSCYRDYAPIPRVGQTGIAAPPCFLYRKNTGGGGRTTRRAERGGTATLRARVAPGTSTPIAKDAAATSEGSTISFVRERSKTKMATGLPCSGNDLRLKRRRPGIPRRLDLLHPASRKFATGGSSMTRFAVISFACLVPLMGCVVAEPARPVYVAPAP